MVTGPSARTVAGAPGAASRIAMSNALRSSMDWTETNFTETLLSRVKHQSGYCTMRR